MRMIKKITVAITMAFVTHGLALAADTQNLMEIYQQALKSDPTLASANSANKAAQEKYIQGRALLLPTITASANYIHNDADVAYLDSRSPFSPGKQVFDNRGYTLNLTQPLFRMQNFVQFKESKIQVSEADKQFILAQQDLMLRTTQAYFDVLTAQDKIELINAQKSAITRQLEQAKANFEVGNATITDVNEAQARYDITLAQEIAATNDLQVKKHTVQSITGQIPNRLATAITDLKPAMPEQGDMEQWIQIAEQNNLNLIVQQKELELASQEVDKQQAAHYPVADLVGSYSDSYATGGLNGFGTDIQNATIGVQVQIPIYQGGSVSSKVREALAIKQKAQDDVEVTRRKVDFETRQAFLLLSSSVAQVKAYEQALASSQSQVDSTTLGYEVGVRTSVDVLNAQQQYFSSKRDLLQARYLYLTSLIKLKSATGLLTEADLTSINQLLEPTSKLAEIR